MHPVAEKYFSLSPEAQKKVQIELCLKAYDLWLEYVSSNGIVEYQETVTGTIQVIDYQLPKDAIDSVALGHDDLDVKQRYLEPATALQDEDITFSDDMEMAYYAIHNLFHFHIANTVEDSWLIMNQSLSALGEVKGLECFTKAVKNAA